jgi:hypothetical protein
MLPDLAISTACLWCRRCFMPRRNGGKPQVFCRPVCRRAFDAAGRQWVANAIATGMLSADLLRNSFAATRALLPVAASPAPVREAQPEHPTPVAPRAASDYTRQHDLERLMAQAVAMRRR